MCFALETKEKEIEACPRHQGPEISHLAPVIRRLDNTIHRINHYPVDKC